MVSKEHNFVLFENICFSVKIGCHRLTRELCTFLGAAQNCASFDTLCGQF
jgi:hypothetical protein